MAVPMAHNAAAEYAVALAQTRHVAIHVQSQPRGNNVQVVVDGRVIEQLSTTMRNGTLYAKIVGRNGINGSAAELFRSLGAQISFDEERQTLRVSELGREVEVPSNARDIFVDGEATPISAPALADKGDFEIPLRSVIEALGADISYRKSYHSMAYISDDNAPALRPAAVRAPKLTVNRAIVLARSPRAKAAVAAARTRASSTSIEAAALLALRGSYAQPDTLRGFTNSAYGLDARHMFTMGSRPLLIDANTRAYRYSTAAGGLNGNQVQLNLGERFGPSPLYGALGYLQMTDTKALSTHGFGFGVLRMPTPGTNWSLLAKFMYYPGTATRCENTSCGGAHAGKVTSYAVGTNHKVGKHGFVDAGYAGDHTAVGGTNATGESHSGFYVGYGVTLK